MSLSSSSINPPAKEGRRLLEEVHTPPPTDIHGQAFMVVAAAAATVVDTAIINNNSSTTTDNILKDETTNSRGALVKGKRTKRQRLQLFHPTATPASSMSSADVISAGPSATEEEEDMANCLILLAQGRDLLERRRRSESKADDRGGGKLTSRRFAAEAAATVNGPKAGAGFYVYECKTCGKCFPSFQALGGHRASHKKPKNMAAAAAAAAMNAGAALIGLEKKALILEEDSINIQLSIAPLIRPNNLVVALNASTTSTINNKSRVHECSICGAEFSSGQALGGHMRRHRPANNPAGSAPGQEAAAAAAKKEKNLMSLDLNLPAPTDDDRAELPKSPATFPFTGKELPLLFSPSALVDCHY